MHALCNDCVMQDNHGHQRVAPATDAGPGDDEFVTALLTASRALVGVSARSLSDVEETVTVAQFRVLVVLATHGHTTLVQLATRLGVNASTAQRQVDRLVREGLVDRQENPDDRREVVIAVTGQGAALVDAVTAHRREAIGRIVQHLPDSDRSALIAALEAFAAAANEPTVGVDPAHSLGW